MITKYIGILVLLFFYLSGKAYLPSDTTCYKNIECDDFNMQKETTDVFIIDVRSYSEYRKERIRGAYSAANKDSLSLLLVGFEKTEPIYVYCVIGVKSKMVSKFICKELGFSYVYSLNGGIKQWKKRGYETDKSKLQKNN